MDKEDDRITSDLYAEGGSNYTTISSLAWRYMYIHVCTHNLRVRVDDQYRGGGSSLGLSLFVTQ